MISKINLKDSIHHYHHATGMFQIGYNIHYVKARMSEIKFIAALSPTVFATMLGTNGLFM